MSIRLPAVAGSFYPADRDELSRLIDSCYLHRLGPGRLPPSRERPGGVAIVVAPHAGLVYSGPVAAHSYLHASSLRKPELAILVGPNHYGVGSGVSASKDGEWETPLGRMKVDSKAADELARATGFLAFDPASHRLEHSLEVQLPFLQKLYGNSVPFVPISIAFQDIETTRALAGGVASVVKGRRSLVVASSDLTHYEPASVARTKDTALIREIEKMDSRAFYSTLESMQVTACGFGAIAVAMEVASLLGFKRAELLKYANSGDTTGDNNQVVGYSSLRFV